MNVKYAALCLHVGLAAAWVAGCSSSSPAPSMAAPGASADSSNGNDPGTGGNGVTEPAPTADPTPTPAPTPAAAPKVSHHRCAWMNDDIELGKASFVANAEFFDAVHPFWWMLATDGTINATSFTDDSTVIATAQAHSVKVMPLIYGGDNVAAIRAVIATPQSIAAHVQTIVQLAVSRHYDGIELDYEHLWNASDRPGYTSLVTQLAEGLHAKGKELSLAIPAIDVDNGQNGYDFAALVKAGADVIHLMGYDFHGIGTDHLGPLAPIGWIDAVAARVEKLGLGSHFVLGIANYGVGSGWYVNSSDAIKLCGSNYSTTTAHMSTCPYGAYEAGVAPHCTTSKGELWFEDGASIAQKAKTAQAHGLRGVSYYSLGGEPSGLFAGMRTAFP